MSAARARRSCKATGVGSSTSCCASWSGRKHRPSSTLHARRAGSARTPAGGCAPRGRGARRRDAAALSPAARWTQPDQREAGHRGDARVAAPPRHRPHADPERAYRGALLDLRHGLDVVRVSCEMSPARRTVRTHSLVRRPARRTPHARWRASKHSSPGSPSSHRCRRRLNPARHKGEFASSRRGT